MKTLRSSPWGPHAEGADLSNVRTALAKSFMIHAFQNWALFKVISLVIPSKSSSLKEEEDGQTAQEGQVPWVCPGSESAVTAVLAIPVT